MERRILSVIQPTKDGGQVVNCNFCGHFTTRVKAIVNAYIKQEVGCCPACEIDAKERVTSAGAELT